MLQAREQVVVQHKLLQIVLVGQVCFVGLAYGAEPMVIRDINGQQHVIVDSDSSPSESPNKATVLIFINTDCPIANSYHPALSQIFDEYCGVNRQGDFAMILIHANPALTVAEAEKHRQDFDIESPIALDPDHRIAKTVKAYVTPEAVVIDGLGRVLYRGRIDDRFAAIGKKRVVPQREDLRLALKSIAVDQPVDIAITQAVGCRITY